MNAAGTITTIAGTGVNGFDEGDGRAATKVPLNNPWGVAVDTHGNVFITDLDARVRKITPAGTIATVAGPTGKRIHQTSKGTGDGGPAILATFAHPVGMAFDRQGNLYIADVSMDAVRKIWVGTAALAKPKTTPKKKTVQQPPASTRGATKAVLSLVNRIEFDLGQMASDRAQLKSALGSVANCSLPAVAAAAQVRAVALGRQRVLNQLLGQATARRSELSPSGVGLPEGGSHRRVALLRRDEVAQLATISTDYYTRLGCVGGCAESRTAAGRLLTG